MGTQLPLTERIMNEAAFREAEQRLWQAAATTVSERRVRLAGDGINVRVLEAGQGPASLFIHGGPGAAGSVWALLAARLPNVRCILVDRPGCGLSDHFTLNVANVRSHSERFVVDLLDALGIDRAHLIGSSHGSYVALVASLRHPDRVARTVHMGCPGFIDGMVASALDRLVLWPGIGWLLSRLPVSEKELLRSVRRLGHGATLDAGLLPREVVDWSLAVAKYTDTMREELRSMANLGSFRGFDPTLTLKDDELSRVQSPTLFYWGENDPYGDPGVGKRLAAAIPAAEIEVVERAGHLPWFDDLDRAAASIQRHIGIPAGTPRVTRAQ